MFAEIAKGEWNHFVDSKLHHN